jgi:hypothetical protein
VGPSARWAPDGRLSGRFARSVPTSDYGLSVSQRPLAVVSALTLGDYLLWNWSLGAGHDVLAVVSGLTLPPLAIAFVWLAAMSVARLLANSTARSRERAADRKARAERRRDERARPAPSPTMYDDPSELPTAELQVVRPSRPPDQLAA